MNAPAGVRQITLRGEGDGIRMKPHFPVVPMKPSKTPTLLTCALVAALLTATGEAALLVQESFSGYAASNLNGQTATGLGLTGSYSGSNGITYTGTGLTFTNIASSGGAMTFSASTALTVGAQLDISPGAVTGDLYSSFLFRKGNNFSSDAASLIESRVSSTIGAAAVDSRFRTQFNTDNASSNVPAVGYDSAPTNYGAAVAGNSTIYLVITKFTNVGTALSGGTTGTARSWILTETQYTNLLALPGGATDANLDTVSLTARGSDAAVTSGTFNFGDGDFIQLAATGSGASPQPGTFDELRYGTTLTDVLPIPEPSVSLLVLVAAGSGLLRRRR